MSSIFKGFINDERGATAVEYGVILALIALLVIFIIKFFLEPQSRVAFNQVGNTVKDFGRIN